MMVQRVRKRVLVDLLNIAGNCCIVSYVLQVPRGQQTPLVQKTRSLLNYFFY